MKRFKKIIALLCSAVFAISLTACSPTEVFDELVEETASNSETEAEIESAKKEVKAIDTSLDKPVFTNEIFGACTMAKGGTYELDGTATVSDGGNITYQWYRNNVNSNGGGTAIKGATDAKYTAVASEVGSVFYYVVAANHHKDGYNMSTSGTFELISLKDGVWKTDDYGKKYVNEDGTYPTEAWMDIAGKTYHFDNAGYASTGWICYYGIYYYFSEDGSLLRNGRTPDGFTTDNMGVLVPGESVPQVGPTTAEIVAQAEQAAAEAAAYAAANEGMVPQEEAPAEEAPVEEAPAEEAPAEE